MEVSLSSIDSKNMNNNMDDGMSSASGSQRNLRFTNSQMSMDGISMSEITSKGYGNENHDSLRSAGGSVSLSTPKKKLHINIRTPQIHLPHMHMPHLPSMHNMKMPNVFRGRGLKKLRMQSKKKRQRRRSEDYKRRKRVNAFLNSKLAMIVLLLASIYMVFIDDLLVATAAPDNNISSNIVNAIKIAVFLIFLVDLILNIFAQRLHYILSFFFIMDLISIASLVPDIVGFIFGISSITSINSLSLSRTARVARIASRLSRVGRIINFFYLFNTIGSKRKSDVQERDEHLLNMPVQPSSVGRKLLSKTSNTIIVMVLLVVLITTLTNPVGDDEDDRQSILNLVVLSANSTGIFSSSFNSTVESLLQSRSDILYLEIAGQDVYTSDTDITNWYHGYILKSDQDNDQSRLWIDNKHDTQVSAALGLTLTVCIIVILCFGTVYLSGQFQYMVIKPIERMISLIKKISSMDRHDSDHESDDFSEAHTGDANTSDGESGVDRFGSDYDSHDTVGGFDDDIETHFIEEMLSDHLTRNIELAKQHKSAVESHNNLSSGIQAVGAAAIALLCRKKFIDDQKQVLRRSRIVKELMTTEQTYVNSLGTSIEGYLMPLRLSNIISVEQCNNLFSNIEVLHQHHKEFFSKLESRVSDWHTNQTIADIFSHIEAAVDIYTTYINNYNNVVPTLDEIRKDEKTSDFLIENRDKHCKGIEITGYLIMPIQRMPRYVLLLEDLLKHTHPDHFEHEDISNAVKSLKKATVVLNERKREHENKHAIQDIYMKLSPPVQDILVPGNSVIKQSKLKQDGEKYYFILLNSGLIKTEKDSNELHVKGYYPIKEISAVAIQDCPSIKIVNAFQIKVDDQSMLLFAKTPELRNEWLEGVAQFVKIMAARTKSMALISHGKRSSLQGSNISNRSPSISHGSSRLSVVGSQQRLSSSNLSSPAPHASGSNLSIHSQSTTSLSVNNNNNNNISNQSTNNLTIPTIYVKKD